MNDNIEWVAKWLNRAKDDLIVAHHVFDDLHPKQIEISCYECHQSAEKALKAYLIFKNCEFPLTHDLRKLCLLCVEFDKGFEDYLNDCADITPYATFARYPNDDDMDETETIAALKKADRIFKFCEQKINSGKQNV
jgi:HEPN domain-containing protein